MGQILPVVSVGYTGRVFGICIVDLHMDCDSATHDRLLILQVEQPDHLIGSCHREYRWCIQVVVSSRLDPQTGDSVNEELGSGFIRASLFDW